MSVLNKQHILSEIQRIAALNGGRAPGVKAFENETGITQGRWYGVHWARWSDAVAEAGLQGNQLRAKFATEDVIRKVAEFALEIGGVPTNPMMKMRRHTDPTFPNPKTVAAHFGNQRGMIAALKEFCGKTSGFEILVDQIPSVEPTVAESPVKCDAIGWVYLLKSSDTYKIGRSENIERRVKQINIALPEAATLHHAIQTDDPSGIEAYWHNRFADRRLNGEWFKLTKRDVAAFKRRKSQ